MYIYIYHASEHASVWRTQTISQCCMVPMFVCKVARYCECEPLTSNFSQKSDSILFSFWLCLCEENFGNTQCQYWPHYMVPVWQHIVLTFALFCSFFATPGWHYFVLCLYTFDWCWGIPNWGERFKTGVLVQGICCVQRTACCPSLLHTPGDVSLVCCTVCLVTPVVCVDKGCKSINAFALSKFTVFTQFPTLSCLLSSPRSASNLIPKFDGPTIVWFDDSNMRTATLSLFNLSVLVLVCIFNAYLAALGVSVTADD